MTRSTRSLSRRFARLACLLGAGAVALSAAGAAVATTPLDPQVRLSVTGAEGDINAQSSSPDVAVNTRTGQRLVVWYHSAVNAYTQGRLVGTDGQPVGDEFHISEKDGTAGDPAAAYNPVTNEYMVVYPRTRGARTEAVVHRVSAAGVEIGDDIVISSMRPGTGASGVQSPDIAYDQTRNEFMVVWQGDDDRGALAPGEYEIYGQRITSLGAETGPDDIRISDMGIDGDANASAYRPRIAWNAAHDEYLVAWWGDDATAPRIDNEFEIHTQRLSGDGTELGENDRRISDAGPAGDRNYDAADPAVAYDPVTDEYAVVWSGNDDAPPMVPGEYEILLQRLAADGTEVGADDQRISDMGTPGDFQFRALEPVIAVDERANEYLVAWTGDDDTPPLVKGKDEVFAQRVSGAGVELDGNDVRVSVTTTDTDTAPTVQGVSVAYAAADNRYQVAWWGDGLVTPINGGDFEIFAKRFGAGTPVALAATLCKAVPPLADPPEGDPSKITLSENQLLINQRIDQAAIRRANGVQAWIDHGVESRDLCQAALGTGELVTGSVGGYTGVPATYAQPDPRPVEIPPAVAGDPSKVTLTVNQLLINQRISQAAIRRLNALKARLDGGLTGGDVTDGAVGRAQLLAGTTVLFTPPVAPAAASVTGIAPASPGDPSKVTLSVNQLLINQRISQAAVKRANELIHRLGEGIGPDEIRNGGLTAADLAPGLALSTTP